LGDSAALAARPTETVETFRPLHAGLPLKPRHRPAPRAALAKDIATMFKRSPEREWRDHIAAVATGRSKKV
jgi:hypothetical protein